MNLTESYHVHGPIPSEAQALRNLPHQQLRRLHRRASREQVFQRLVTCASGDFCLRLCLRFVSSGFTLARCDDLEKTKAVPREHKSGALFHMELELA